MCGITKLTTLGNHNIFGKIVRERCMINLQKLNVPNQWRVLSPDAAVLVPLCNIDGVPSLLYTVTVATRYCNGGQVTFPGGKMIQGEQPEQAALREMHETLGISPEKVNIWGSAVPVPGRNGCVLVSPIIGAIQDLKKEDVYINTAKVTEAFAVALTNFCDPKNQYSTQLSNGVIMPVFLAGEYKIWGMTAFLTHTFLSCLLPKDVYRNAWTMKRVVLDK